MSENNTDMENVNELQPIDTNTMVPISDMPLPTDNILLNTKAMNQLYKMAQFFAKSSVVPINYQGKVENCFVACEMAARMNVSPTMVMQNLYIVQGRPSWSGQACISMINNCGRFRGILDFVYTGEKGTPTYGCYAQAYRKEDGRLIKGTEITLQMAQDENWSTKPGSKWKTMPEQMLSYRAAAFFARLYCPEALMGLQTAEEVADIHGTMPPPKSKTVISLEEQ